MSDEGYNFSMHKGRLTKNITQGTIHKCPLCLKDTRCGICPKCYNNEYTRGTYSPDNNGVWEVLYVNSMD